MTHHSKSNTYICVFIYVDMKPSSLIYFAKCELLDALDNLSTLSELSDISDLVSLKEIISLVDTAYDKLNDLKF